MFTLFFQLRYLDYVNLARISIVKVVTYASPTSFHVLQDVKEVFIPIQFFYYFIHMFFVQVK